MKKEKKKIVDWIKEHKTELIIAGVSVSALVMLILGIKNKETLEEFWSSLKRVTEEKSISIDNEVLNSMSETFPVQEVPMNNIILIERIPHNVDSHLRNLPEGWRASAEKIATAAEHGYELLPGQTWVEAYRTGGVAA